MDEQGDLNKRNQKNIEGQIISPIQITEHERNE
jgi:hypothetical protein